MGPGRARAGIVLLAALALASLSTSVPGAQASSRYNTFEAQLDASGILAYGIETNLRAAQSFVPGANFTATQVGLVVEDTGRDDALTVRIVPDLAGVPDTGTPLVSATNNTGPAFGWANFTFGAGVNLVRGTRYWVLAEDNAGNGEGYLWRYEPADVYARGVAATASGGTWIAQSGDFAFIVFGWTPSQVAMAIAADRTTVAGGETLRLTIDLTNGGTEDASNAWVNVTLDPRLRFANAGPGPVSAIGSAVSFHPPTIPNGTSVLFLNVTGDAILQDGLTLTIPVSAEFYDGVASRYLATSATVRTAAPLVTASLTLARSTVDPGSLVTYFVTVTNSGNATARHVWVNETLHPALTYLSDTAPVAADQSGARQSWHFLDVAPGVSLFNVTAQVEPGTAASTVIANFLSVEFTDPAGAGLVRGKSNTVWLGVGGFATGGGNPWLWGSFVISATVVGGTYLAYARRRLRTEEIFLIHHSGVLLVHMSKSIKADHDSDIVSGMLTAILNFVRDAFHYEERQELQGLDLGQYRVHVRKGGITYLALVHTGKPTRWLARSSARAVAEIESQHGALLRTWDGDLSTVAGVRDILKGYFLSPTGPSRSRTWLHGVLARFDQTFKPMRPL